MRKILILIVLCSYVALSQNKEINLNSNKNLEYCVWPYSDTIYQNTSILVEIYGCLPINREEKNNWVNSFFLVSKNDTISMEVLQVITKDCLNQVLIKPKGTPQIGIEYEFVIASFNDKQKYVRRSRLIRIQEKKLSDVQLKTSKNYYIKKSVKSKELTQWEDYPHPMNSESIHSSSKLNKSKNPIISYISFMFKLNPNISECLILLNCWNLRTGVLTQHYFDSTQNEILIGHDEKTTVINMYETSDVYDMNFEILEINSNKTTVPGFITLISPTNRNYILRKQCQSK